MSDNSYRNQPPSQVVLITCFSCEKHGPSDHTSANGAPALRPSAFAASKLQSSFGVMIFAPPRHRDRLAQPHQLNLSSIFTPCPFEPRCPSRMETRDGPTFDLRPPEDLPTLVAALGDPRDLRKSLESHAAPASRPPANLVSPHSAQAHRAPRHCVFLPPHLQNSNHPSG
jgi:hypothetical protein